MKVLVLMVVSFIIGLTVGAFVLGKKMNGIACSKQKEKEKFRLMYEMMEHWMRIRQREEKLVDYFKTYNYKRIAIYGMGNVGKLLYKELEDSDIEISYCIDQNKDIFDKTKMYSLEDSLPDTDAIVVTAIAYYDEIEKNLNKKTDCKVISLEDIVYEMV